MKKTLLFLALACASLSATAQQTTPATAPSAAPAGYTDLMAAAVKELYRTGDPVQLKELASKFERASAAAPADWLPAYHRAYALLIATFQGKESSDVKDKNLDQAEASLAQARKLKGDESELLVLQAYIHQARLGINPMARSGKYSPQIKEALDQAKKLNPANPRIYLVQGNQLYFMPKMFGGGADVAKPVFEEAKVRFAAARPASPLLPAWGERQVLSRLKSYEAQAAK
ncbi:hypothetical protein LJY25_09935 [Hymenobacter sp. BT175]|uniref:hypothetical protein n=1 Tax=Hymenobacter translucens TaxID=2886507 RepID=UPI001D0EB8EA|nr:hypothetical protein [Hymenobacter translucens]MCC2546762.1 hypothetical protein [Hymenobacter translucens]